MSKTGVESSSIGGCRRPWPISGPDGYISTVSAACCRDLPIDRLRSLLQRSSEGCHKPALRQELRDGTLLNAFLHAQFVV